MIIIMYKLIGTIFFQTMAMREAGERQHDNAGRFRKLSSVAAGHTSHVKEKHMDRIA
jgi:hypothetical protein